MKTDKGIKTGGTLAISAKEFSCKIGDSVEQIVKENPHLSSDEVQQVFEITREQIDEAPENGIEYEPTTED